MGKIKLFTHTDLDGVGCYILAKQAFEDVDVEYCDYTNINECVKRYIENKEYINNDFCCITDISISDEIAQLIENTYPEEFDNDFGLNEHFQLLDHHPTAMDLNKYWWCEVSIMNEQLNIKTSGTEMFYVWLRNGLKISDDESIIKFVELVRNYDTWRWTELGEDGLICKQVNDLLYLYGRDRFIVWCTSQIHDCVFPILHKADKLVLKIKQQEIDEYIESKSKKMIKTKFKNYNMGVVFADKYHSELGNKLCSLNNDIDFVAIINMDTSISYRTIKEDVNVGVIAKELGGGGHPKASGSKIDGQAVYKLLDLLFS